MAKKSEKNTQCKQEVLVTGGAGFIGSHLCERLLKEKYKVVCLDNFNDFLYSPKLKRDNLCFVRDHPDFVLVKGDILDETLLRKVFRENKIQKIIHLAALAGVRPSLFKPSLYVENNIKGTVNLLEIARTEKVKQFIYASSSSVYGNAAKVPFSETEKNLEPISPYGASKLAGEIFCQTYNELYNIPITILRFFTVYGPRQRPEMGIHKFVRMARNNEALPIYAGGDSSRDYTHVDDITAGVLQSLEKEFDFEIFNLGNSNPIKLIDLIGIIKRKLHVKLKMEIIASQLGDVVLTCADITKSRKLLGWTPKISIEEGIKSFVEWYKEKENVLAMLHEK